MELYHYGVKGMKWGVRRNRNKGDTGKRRIKKSMSANDRKVADMKKAVKNRRTLSNEELKQRIDRIKTERQLKDLTEEDITPGRRFVKSVLSQSGRKVAATVATGAMLYGIKAAMTGRFDIKEAAGYVAPKPKNK